MPICTQKVVFISVQCLVVIHDNGSFMETQCSSLWLMVVMVLNRLNWLIDVYSLNIIYPTHRDVKGCNRHPPPGRDDIQELCFLYGMQDNYLKDQLWYEWIFTEGTKIKEIHIHIYFWEVHWRIYRWSQMLIVCCLKICRRHDYNSLGHRYHLW